MLEDRPYLRGSTSPAPSWPTSVVLIVVIGAFFVLQQIADLASGNGPSPMQYLELDPRVPFYFWTWQLITFQFLHGGPFHLIINCLMIYMFGRYVEDAMGRAGFLKLYFTSGVMGGVLQVLFSLIFPSHFGLHPVVGASAGVCGLVAAFCLLHWEQPITALVFFIIPVNLRAKYLVLVVGIIAAIGMLDRSSHIAHAAHLGGLLAGLAYIRYLDQYRITIDWSRLRTSRGSPVRRTRPRSAWKKILTKPKTQSSVEDLPPTEFISAEIDPILDKISAHGINSLSERERKILEAARSRMDRQ